MGLFTGHANSGDRNVSQATLPGEVLTGHTDQSIALPATASKPADYDAVNANPPLNFDQLVMRCMGRLELAQRLLASFERRFPLELSQIEQSLETGDLPAFVRQAHQLKGASANVSAPGLHAILKRIEEAGRVEQLDRIAAGLAELRGAWNEFQQYKSNCVSEPTQPGQACDVNSGPRQSPETPSCAY
jgi:HPt (histidine-containing phosphotransfer) domain-containing protein